MTVKGIKPREKRPHIPSREDRKSTVRIISLFGEESIKVLTVPLV